MHKGCKGILFDFDGTLVNLDVDWESVRQKLSALFGQFLVDFNTSSVLGSIRQAYDFLIQDPERKQAADKFFYQAHDIITQEELAALDRATLVPGAREILEWLVEASIPVAILSNNDSCCVRMGFAKFGLPTPAVIIGRDTISSPKPRTEGALLALDLLEITPSECWLVGNSSPDLQVGRALGIKTVLLLPFGTQNQQLGIGQEVVTVNGLIQLRPLLENAPKIGIEGDP